MVLAQVAYLVTLRLMRLVRTGQSMQKYATPPSVSVRVKLGSHLALQAFSALDLCSASLNSLVQPWGSLP